MIDMNSMKIGDKIKFSNGGIYKLIGYSIFNGGFILSFDDPRKNGRYNENGERSFNGWLYDKIVEIKND